MDLGYALQAKSDAVERYIKHASNRRKRDFSLSFLLSEGLAFEISGAADALLSLLEGAIEISVTRLLQNAQNTADGTLIIFSFRDNTSR